LPDSHSWLDDDPLGGLYPALIVFPVAVQASVDGSRTVGVLFTLRPRHDEHLGALDTDSWRVSGSFRPLPLDDQGPEASTPVPPRPWRVQLVYFRPYYPITYLNNRPGRSRAVTHGAMYRLPNRTSRRAFTTIASSSPAPPMAPLPPVTPPSASASTTRRHARPH